ncbi:hypothetical protein ACFQ5N_03280 [Lutibacter holmesii]|uniref:Uncharacterized protein n=1 Tax=Lutibacter holmesii TaxID=1137985 RepID=A0ABW3WKV7_9FLAO
MSALKFTFPSDTKILQDIDSTSCVVKFIGTPSVNQSLDKQVFTRIIRFNNENVTKKVTYIKRGYNWGFQNLEVVKL